MYKHRAMKRLWKVLGQAQKKINKNHKTQMKSYQSD